MHTLMKERELDFLLTSETSHYVGALIDELEGTPWKFVGYRSDPDPKAESDIPARDSGIVMRREYEADRRLHDLGGVGWERGEGRPGLHTPRKMVSGMIDGRFRVGSVHLPPTPDLAKFPKRDRAHEVAVHRLLAIAGQWNPPWLLGGDWNMLGTKTGSEAEPTPRWLSGQLDATIVTQGGIDYTMDKGLEVRKMQRIDYGTSDHKPRIYEVVVR